MNTFQALAVTLLAVLPGAVYTFAVERSTGPFGVSRPDRALRFTAASAVFIAVFAGPGYAVYRDFAVTGRFAAGAVNPFVIWALAIAYVLVPAGAGTLVGYGRKKRWLWATWVVGEAPEPRAWDYVWGRGHQGLVRAKMKSGVWVAGIYGTGDDGKRSYASGYPEAAQELYLAEQLSVDSRTGEWTRGEEGEPVSRPGGLLLHWDQIEFIEFTEVDGNG